MKKKLRSGLAVLALTMLGLAGARAQSPGGVAANLKIWLRPEAFSPSSWSDASGSGNNFTQTNAGRQPFLVPAVGAEKYNFNAFVDFGTTGSDARFMVVPDGGPYSANGSNSTLFTASMSRNVSGYSDILGFGATTTGAGLINANSPVYTNLSSNIVIYPYIANAGLPTVQGGKIYLNDVSFTVGTAGIKYGQNGQTGTVNSTFASGNADHADGAVLGAQPEERNGLIGEVIAYERDLTEAEKIRVRSYLAIKYGLTLPHNYVASNGSTVFWDQTTNTGYNNNIAGIARDAGSLQNQKQSKSINDGNQVLIATMGLADANAANTTELTDGQFLLWGDNGLAKAPAVALTGPGINFRFAAIWKVQNSGSVGTVRVAWPAGLTNLKLIQSSDETIDGSDPATDMTATQTVNGVSYNYADISLTDGQFFTFAAYVQAPGGVAANLLMWHKANDGVSTAGAKAVWKDASVNGRDVTQNNNATNQPSLVTDAAFNADSKNYSFNFNPFYYFDGSNDFFYRDNDAYFPSTASAGSTYGIMFNSANSGWRTPYGWGDDDPNLVRGDNNYLIGRDNGAVINENVGLNSMPVHLAGMFWKGSGAANNGMYLNVNGRVYTAPNVNIGTINDANNFAIGSEGVSLTGNGFEVYQGGISEVFAYSDDHQNSVGDEKQRINSYLAVKYGITLSNADGTGASDYLSSTSQVVWGAATNNGYNNNIAGIARDENSALHQKQSFSSNAGQQVLIGTIGLGNTNEANATGLTNGQFLIWGDNGQTKAPNTYNAGLGHGVNVHFKAIWKVQNTGGVGTVRVAWPTGLNNLSLVQSGDATIDGSDVFTPMASNTQTINGVTYNYADVTLANGQYFTFAVSIQNAPGGVFTGLSQWYRADMSITNTGDATDVTAWTDVASGIVASQVTGVALPKFKTGAADYLNFNPGVNFTATNQTIGNLTVQTLSAQQYDVFTLTKEGIIPGGNGRIFSSLADNAFQTGSIAYWDGLGINAANSVERVNTSYSYRYLANPGNVDWSTNSPSIMYHTFTNTSVAKGLNGAAKGATATHPAIGDFNGGYTIGTTQFPGNGSDNAGFIGHIGELVVYGSGNITAAERNKVDSYLAIKYGVTLSDTVNYITSAGDTVWNAATNTGFYKNVAGLGRDNISALHQKQSRSQHANTNSQVTIGLGQIAATNQANPGAIADGQFLIWGDNGQTLVMTNSASSYSGFLYNGSTDNGRIMKRTWKVQNTDMGQEVLIRFPQASVGNTTFPGEGCSQLVLVLGNDAGFTTNAYVVPLTVNGTDYEVRHTFPAGASYFTFGKVNGWAPGIVQLPAAVTAAPDFSTCASNSWYYAKQTAGTDKYLAIKGMTPAQLGNLDVVIDPVGAEFNGTIHTKLMPRVATVTDAGAGTYTGVKVRVYFSQSEMDATIVSGAMKNGWFKFEGDADAVRSDINADGLMNPANAIELVPSGSGVEDGIKYVEFDNVTKFSSFVFVSTTNETALPVRLVRFDAAKKGGSALLTWETAQESGNKGFEIQRGAGNSGWQTIGFVGGQTEDGNSSAVLQYSFTDETPLAGKNYYRLKQVDWDGSSAYSRIEVIDFSASGKGLVLYPNPVAGGVITLDLPEGGVLEVKIYNLSGNQVKAFKQMSRMLDVKGLSSGKYILKTVSENGQVYEKTFIIP